MAFADMAREKAQEELDKGQQALKQHAAELEAARARVQAAQKALTDKAHAATSARAAEIDELQRKLGDAQADLDAVKAQANLTEAVTRPGIIRGVSEPFRQAADSRVTSTQAKVDDLQAQISQLESQQVTPPETTSPELQAAQKAAHDAQDKIDADQMRISLAQKALDALTKKKKK